MKKRYSIVFLLVICIFTMLEPMNVFAIDNIDSDRAKSLTIYFYTQKTGVDTPIEGAEVAVTKIADTSVVNGNLDITVDNRYSDLIATNFNGISVSESIEISKRFAAVTTEYDFRGITDKNGECVFNITDNGVYLIQELSKQNDAELYRTFEPYIILVPFVSNMENEWKYDVLSEPKTVIIQGIDSQESDVSEPPDNPPDDIDEPSDITDESEVSIGDDQPGGVVTTGDMVGYITILGLTCVSLLLIVLLFRKDEIKNDKKS